MAGPKNGTTPTVHTHNAPLPAAVRQQMEQSFGADLSGVRVHAASFAIGASGNLGARAMTVGQDIHFAPGQYAPASQAGRQLLAHELAHVVQQGGPPQAPRLASAETQLAGYAAAAGDEAPMHVVSVQNSNNDEWEPSNRYASSEAVYKYAGAADPYFYNDPE